MKRKTLKFMACAAVMALTLSVTACGGSDDGAKTADTAKVEDTVNTVEVPEPEEEPEVETETEGEADTKAEEEESTEDETEVEYASLEEMFDDPEIKEAFDSMFSVLEGSGISVSIDVIGNDFGVTLKIEDSSLLEGTSADDFAASLDAQEEQYAPYAAQFDELLGEAGTCSVTVRYTDPDDNVLAEKTFKAN